MNNDIVVEQADWLRLMVDEALADPRVGIVGVKLVYPNQTVQHGGVVLGVGGVADHTFRYAPRDEKGYAFRAVCASDLSAVTAACMLCRADAFRDVGMFDEARLAVAFNDVDLCLKVGRAGWRIVYLPAVVAEHHESLSRGNDLADHNVARFYDENQTMWDRWGGLIRSDPYYNPHFSHETGMFEKLSSASLDPARAPSLLHRPVPRAVLADPKPLPARPVPARAVLKPAASKAPTPEVSASKAPAAKVPAPKAPAPKGPAAKVAASKAPAAKGVPEAPAQAAGPDGGGGRGGGRGGARCEKARRRAQGCVPARRAGRLNRLVPRRAIKCRAWVAGLGGMLHLGGIRISRAGECG